MNNRIYRALALLLVALLLLGAASFPDDSAWSTFQSTRWGYSLAYPSAWHAEITLHNADAQPPEVLRERLSIRGPLDAEITLQVWAKAPTQGLLVWVAAVQDDFLMLGGVALPATSNARIAGHEALLLSQPGGCGGPPLLLAYIDAGDRILLVQYTVRDKGAALEIYRALLASLTITSESSLAGAPYLVLPSIIPETNATDPCDYAPIERGCCGYPQVPLWQCSLDLATLQQRGNCTYWAAYKRPDVAAAVGSGNAGQWAAQAQSAGCNMDTLPRVGDIMVREGGSRSRGLCDGGPCQQYRHHRDGLVYLLPAKYAHPGVRRALIHPRLPGLLRVSSTNLAGGRLGARFAYSYFTLADTRL